MIGKNEKDELLCAIRDMRKDFSDMHNEFKSKPFIDQDQINHLLKDHNVEIVGFNIGIKNKIKEIDELLRNKYKQLRELEDRIEFYYNHLMRDTHGYDITFHDDMTHNEDELFNACIDYIAKYHVFNIKKVDFHKRIDGIEFDCIAQCTTSMGKERRSIGLEFKEVGIKKAIDQSLIRKNYTNVQYLVSDESCDWILENALPIIEQLKKSNIGLITMTHINNQKYPVMLLKSEVSRKAKYQELEI